MNVSIFVTSAMRHNQPKDTHPAGHEPTMPSRFDLDREIDRFLLPDGASRIVSHGIESHSDEHHRTTDSG
jgi:hypothetical protein